MKYYIEKYGEVIGEAVLIGDIYHCLIYDEFISFTLTEKELQRRKSWKLILKDMQKAKVAVIAGTLTEYLSFISHKLELGLHNSVVKHGQASICIDNAEFFYVMNINKLRGLRNFSVQYIGTFYLRKDWDEINSELEYKRSTGDIIEESKI
jgi:hypothetical protein